MSSLEGTGFIALRKYIPQNVQPDRGRALYIYDYTYEPARAIRTIPNIQNGCHKMSYKWLTPGLLQASIDMRC